MESEIVSTRVSKHSGRVKRNLGRFVGFSILFLAIAFTVAIYSFFLAIADQNNESMKTLGQNFGTIIITVGVSFPAIIAALYPIKYNEAPPEKKNKLQIDIFSFVLAFVVFIGVNTLSFMALYSPFIFSKGLIIATMIGSLIGLVIVFLFELAKLTKSAP